MGLFVAYYRVSTQKQDYGLTAQRQDVLDFVSSRGGSLLQEFAEKESGKNNNRPELEKAITYAKAHNATLLIAKIDRLSRNVSFLFKLKEELQLAGIQIIAVDMPELLHNTLTLAVMAGLAQQERELISQRTKAGLAVARSLGKTIGRKKGADTSSARDKALESIQSKALKHAEEIGGIVKTWREDKGMSYQEIASYLNGLGKLSPRGCQWTATGIRRVCVRIGLV